MATLRPHLLDRLPEELELLAVEAGLPRYRGRQLARGVLHRGVGRWEELTDLPAAWRERLAADYAPLGPTVVESERADDGTTKYLFAMDDGRRVEAVAIPRPQGRFSYCLSSQVGCRMACVFCATGRMGLIRHLSAGEIVAQVLELRRRHPSEQNPSLVFMGMGEPLDNFDALSRALELLTRPDAVGLGARKITVSTSGVLDGIRRLGELGRPYGLALSLTSSDPEERRRLMPIAGRDGLDELLAVAADYGRRHRRKVTLECALIAGVNDRPEDAQRLLKLARRGPFKVNLIPLNPIDPYPGERPEPTAVDRFADILWRGGIVATVRDSAGREISAACGQLVHRQRRPRRGDGDAEE